MKLTSLEDLLETSRRTGAPVGRQDVLAEVNLILEAELGDVVDDAIDPVPLEPSRLGFDAVPRDAPPQAVGTGPGDEVEILEDLIVAASADGKPKVETCMQEKMSEITGGRPLSPGMKRF